MSSKTNKRIVEIKTTLSANALAKEGFQHLRKITPILSGNARRKTSLNGDTIIGDYPYAQRLDQGASKQAPDGMTQPTVEYISEWVQKQSKG